MASRCLQLAVAVMLSIALQACGDSAPAEGAAAKTAQSAYSVHYLVSDGTVPADHMDANLKNPWGIAFGSGPVWLSDNGTNLSTVYDGSGAVQSIVVSIPAGANGDAAPTGIVSNASSTAFRVPPTAGLPVGLLGASFIFDGEGGTIAGWSVLNGSTAVTMYDDGAGGAIYKGLALASSGGASYLYAADFHNGKIDRFDSSYAKSAAPGGFTDPALPAGYAPFNVQALGDKLYVTYAKQRLPGAKDEMDGPGLGVVDAYDADGHLLQRVATAGALNAPWGMALAPAGFGAASGDLLIGNFGDGRINIYDPSSGMYLGALSDGAGMPIAVEGLWALAFGNGANGQAVDTLYFTAGVNEEAGGVYGSISCTTC